MKKKLAAVIVMAVISMELLACGSKNSVSAGTMEVTDGSSVSEKVTSEEEKDVTTDEVSNEEAEDDREEVLENKENVPTWYMDEEGIKNKELGFTIRKDNMAMEKIEFVVNYGIFTPSEGGGGIIEQQIFRCTYYDGDLDSYISENKGMEKGTIGDISYAYGNTEDSYFNVIAFVGNGIIISTDLRPEENLVDYLDRINLVQSYDGSFTDCLAYITDNGLCCPALGIKLTCEENENNSGNIINAVSVYCSWPEATMSIKDESIQGMGTIYYMSDTQNAQEVVDKYVEGAESVIDGTVEVILGTYKFLGRGVVSKYSWQNDTENWLFYSDETTWSVNVIYDVGNNYEDYLSVIEELK